MTLSEERHSDLLLLVEELKQLVSAGYAAPEDPFRTRLDKMNEILWESYLP